MSTAHLRYVNPSNLYIQLKLVHTQHRGLMVQ